MKKCSIGFLTFVALFFLAFCENSRGATLYEVHSWPDSRCGLCHLSSTPDATSALLVEEDQSRLCESCHSGSLTELVHHSSGMVPIALKNHPVKLSPLDFDAQRINQNIVQSGGNFYVSGQGGEVRLFGTSAETAVTECSSCHDPHGKSGLPLLQYTSNPGDDLCLICHLLKNTLTKNTM